ncbi:MAG: hypothetical protein M0012_05575 [Deltaproteobacteria bacterium]|nr:hypothetical protein [Deltaproteobacteria bacterium]
MEAEEYVVLKAEIKAQLIEIENIYAKIVKRKSGRGLASLESLSYQLHNLYCAYEDLFKIIAKTFENHIDDKNHYHIELLKRMTITVEGMRPAILSRESYLLLDNLRSFRHFFRHAYAYELDRRKVKLVTEDAMRIKPLFAKDIEKFVNVLSVNNN